MSTSKVSVLSIKTVTLTPGQTYTYSSGDTNIVGSTGSETVVLPDNITNITIANSVENLNLSKGIFNYGILPNGSGGAYLYNYVSGLMANISASSMGIHINFGDHSSLTLYANAQGNAQIHYDKEQLTPNLSLTLSNGDITLWGSTGKETVNIPSGIAHVICDNAVEVVNLGVNYDPSLLILGKGLLSLKDAQQNNLLDWSVNSSSGHTLSFNNAIGNVTVNSAGQDEFTLTDLLLGSSQTYTSTTSHLNLYGTSGNETVVIGAGVHFDSIDSRIEKVVLPLALSKYTWTTQGSTLTLLDNTNTQVALINVERTSTGTTLQFNDQTLNAVINSSGVHVYTSSGQLVNSGSNGLPTSTGSSSTAPIVVPTSTSSSSSSSAPVSATSSSSHFQYTLDFSAFSGYSAQQSAVQTCLVAALNKIGNFLNAKGSLDIQVIPENTSSNVLAEASGALVSVPSGLSTAHGGYYTTAFLAESQMGVDPNGSQADAKVYINMSDWSLFNTNPAVAPSKSQYDLTSVLTHEMFHALGFDGMYPSSKGYTTTYDTFIQMQNGLPYFIGPKAEAVYGGPVPLDPASAGAGSAYYHVKVTNDMMSDAISAGTVRSISALDIAMMQDLGAPVLVGVAAV